MSGAPRYVCTREGLAEPPEQVVLELRRYNARLNIRWDKLVQKWRVVQWARPLCFDRCTRPIEPREWREGTIVLVCQFTAEAVAEAVKLDNRIVDFVRSCFVGTDEDEREFDRRELDELDAQERAWEAAAAPSEEKLEDAYYELKAQYKPGVRPDGGWPTFAQEAAAS